MHFYRMVMVPGAMIFSMDNKRCLTLDNNCNISEPPGTNDIGSGLLMSNMLKIDSNTVKLYRPMRIFINIYKLRQSFYCHSERIPSHLVCTISP